MTENNLQSAGAEQAAGAHVARGRRTLILLFLAGGLPVLVSFGLYFSGAGIPDGRTNRGMLIQPPLTLGAADFVGLENGEPLVFRPDEKWLVFVAGGTTCDEACTETLYKLRQATKALGRHALRVKRGYVLAGEKPSEELTRWAGGEHPGMQFIGAPSDFRARLQASASAGTLTGNEIFIVDPIGNVMMMYAPGQDGRDLLDDLNRLLKVSKIG